MMMTEASEFVECRRCGKSIPAGNFCDHCKLGLSQDVDEEIRTLKEESESISQAEEVKGMHYYPPLERERRSRLV